MSSANDVEMTDFSVETILVLTSISSSVTNFIVVSATEMPSDVTSDCGVEIIFVIFCTV